MLCKLLALKEISPVPHRVYRDPKTKSAHLKMALWMIVSPWGSFPISFSQTCKVFHPELQCMLIAVVFC